MKLKDVFLLISFLLFQIVVFAQNNITVSGTVTDYEGQPLPGATVLTKGTSIGTQADFDGNYVLNNVPSDGVLVFSYIGFSTLEIPVNNQNSINASLFEDTQRLDEVVVVGYGEQKRSDITGAVVSIKSDEIVKQPALTAVQSIQGKIAGVNIIASDQPGSTPSVIVRGIGSAEGGRLPLYIVDGQPLQDIRSINPVDIESIEFLKGASYANIYGIRAANGVILITTKKGQKGKPVFRFDSFISFRNVLNRVELANGEEYRQYFNEESQAIGGFLLDENQRYNTDWYDELLQTGVITNNNFSVSGATENIDYFFSFNYHDEEGILEGDQYNRGSIRTNNTFHLLNKKVRIRPNLNYTYTNETPKPLGAFNMANRQSPLVPVRFDNGRFGQSFVNQTTGEVTYIAGPDETVGRLNVHGNPVATVFFADEATKSNTLQGQISLEADFTNYLTGNVRFGATQFNSKRNVYSPTREIWLNADPTRTLEEFELGRSDPDGDGIISEEFANNLFTVTDVEFFRWNLEGFLTFKKSFKNHNLTATAGLSRENFGGRERLEGQARDVFEQERLRSLGRQTSSFFEKTVDQEFNQSTNLQSYYARFNYNYAEKYFLRGVVRRDGTSSFITGDNFFDNFPAFSVGWTLSKENFLKNSKTINFLKLFGGWGQIGNGNVPINVQQIQTHPDNGDQNYVFGPTQELVFGASFGSPVLPIQWEVTEEWETGFDFALFNNRLSGTFTYYDRNNTNAIINVQPTLSSGAGNNFLAHAGEVSNRGMEVLLNWKNSVSEDFNYSVGVNFSTNKNRVQNVIPGFDGETGGGLFNGQVTKRLTTGQPLFAWWVLEANGVWQTQEEIDNNPSLGGAAPGHLRYVDQNDDGVIDDRDRIHSGNYLPTFNYGLNLVINYKRFDLSIDGFGVGGNKVYNGLANTRLGGENISKEVYDNRWTGPGSTNSNPGAFRDVRSSTHWLEDGDFFRVNNITLGYSINNSKLGFANRVRLYATAQNPFMFTNYTGFTPEINGNGDPSGLTGVELNAYPTTRSLVLGINVEL